MDQDCDDKDDDVIGIDIVLFALFVLDSGSVS